MSLPAGKPPAARLSGRDTALVLAVAIGVFLLLGGPIWAHRWDPDASIVFSYVPIPVLVFALLLVRRRFGLGAFAVETLRIVFLKFGITASFLLLLWTLQDPPVPVDPLAPLARRTPTPAPLRTATPTAAPAVSRIPPGTLGDVAGVATDANGGPLGGATVYVAAGLERFVFPPGPDTSVTFASLRLAPAPVVVSAGAGVGLRSGDGRLHTAHAWLEPGVGLFNVPLLPSGVERRVTFPTPGAGGIRCEVHPEETAPLLVVPGGFVATTGPDGRFTLRGIPAGWVRLAVLGRPGATRDVEIVAGARADGSIQLP